MEWWQIALTALIGPLLILVIDLWFRPQREAGKDRAILLQDLEMEITSLFGLISTGMIFVKNYKYFTADSAAKPTHKRTLMAKLNDDFNNVRRLSELIGKLGAYRNFNKDFITKVVKQLAEIAGGLGRIHDTVDARNFKLFNGVNKTSLGKYIYALNEIQEELNQNNTAAINMVPYLKRRWRGWD